jgi:hypothetical protein
MVVWCVKRVLTQSETGTPSLYTCISDRMVDGRTDVWADDG